MYAYSLCVSDKSGDQKSATINILQKGNVFWGVCILLFNLILNWNGVPY